MCETEPFTKAELAEMSDREIAALLEGAALGSGDVETARICVDAVRRLREWNDFFDLYDKGEPKSLDELKASYDRLFRRNAP